MVSKSGIDLPSETMTLTIEDLHKTIPGFVKLSANQHIQGLYAKALASAFIKFTTEGRNHTDTDSVQSFIALYNLHRDLTEQATMFLKEEVPFIYQDQQIQPLLLNFAAYRLKLISRRYYYASLQNQPSAILADLKAIIRQRQEEYDTLLQHV